MPSGHAHDAITILLAAPVAVGTCALTRDLPIAVIVSVAFIVAGLMFGPDLDTKSKPYSRWGPLRIIWLPYRTIFRHRSRWSHGLVFGTLLRVVYFLGIATIIAFAAMATFSFLTSGEVPGFAGFVRGWKSAGMLSSSTSVLDVLLAIFVGMWTGAASHTLTDIAITYIKTGRAKGLL
ncbi:MAG: metal-binding protein [bacterium]|nr:metal-binding protein [bacterium]